MISTRRQHATCSAALLALSVAVCLGSPGAMASGGERRVSAEADEAVASLMACLNEVAKTLVGQTAAVVTDRPDRFDLPAAPVGHPLPLDDQPVVSVQPHVSLLNLPPPAPLS